MYESPAPMVSTTFDSTAGMLIRVAGVASSEPDEPWVMTARSAPKWRMCVAVWSKSWPGADAEPAEAVGDVGR